MKRFLLRALAAIALTCPALPMPAQTSAASTAYRFPPAVLMVDAAGRRQVHGTRQHACWSVEAYRARVAKIVHELGRRYGKDARVWGWQLDNELTHYGKEPCFCDACQHKFQGWLQKKYGE